MMCILGELKAFDCLPTSNEISFQTYFAARGMLDLKGELDLKWLASGCLQAARLRLPSRLVSSILRAQYDLSSAALCIL